MCLVRLPLTSTDGLHLVRLYDEAIGVYLGTEVERAVVTNPWLTILGAALVAARLRAQEAEPGLLDRDDTAQAAWRLRRRVLVNGRLNPPYLDKPVIGTGLLGFAIWMLDADVGAEHGEAWVDTGLQLLALAGSLSSGLDVGALGGELLSEVSDRIPNRGLALYVPRGDALTPVASTVDLDPDALTACETLAGDVLRGARERSNTVEIGQGFAFRVSDQAIVAGLRPIDSEPSAVPLAEVAQSLGDNAPVRRVGGGEAGDVDQRDGAKGGGHGGPWPGGVTDSQRRNTDGGGGRRGGPLRAAEAPG